MGEKIFEKRIQVISRYNKDLYRLVDVKTGAFKNAKIVEMREDGVVLDWRIEADQSKTPYSKQSRSGEAENPIPFLPAPSEKQSEEDAGKDMPE